jgi:PKD repeat protein
MKILSSTESKLNCAIVAALLLSLTLFTTFFSSNAAAAPPIAVFVFDPTVGNTSSTIKFNASSSSNPGGNFSDLSFRWDWQDDGIFDTSWSGNYTAEHQYTSPGIFWVRLEVKNLTGQIDNATAPVPIDDSPPVVTLFLPDDTAFKNGIKDAADFENVSSSIGLNLTTITMNGLVDGDHYIIVRVTNSARLTTVVGVEFKASATVVEEPPIDAIWIIVTLLVVLIGIVASILLLKWRWEKNPPEGLDLTPPGLPPVM